MRKNIKANKLYCFYRKAKEVIYMQKRLKKIQSYLSNADIKKDSFIIYCLCVELLDLLNQIIKKGNNAV